MNKKENKDENKFTDMAHPKTVFWFFVIWILICIVVAYIS